MDLSNLRTSLREEELSSARRTAHLRAAEDELNAFFRSSALGLTTLYRQGVAATKTSYEKGYAHALAHVLELWDQDHDWLKGYLQRRIEALEAAVEDEPEEAMDAPQTREQEQQQASTSFNRANATTRQANGATESPARQTNKRSRTTLSEAASSSQRCDPDDSPVQLRHHRMPHTPSARLPTSSSASLSGSSFNFAAPLAYPSSSTLTATTSTNPPSKRSTRSVPTEPSGGVIKTSNATTSRRRLQKLKGLRAGRAERIVGIDNEDEILPDGDDADAWTDDDDEAQRRGRVVVWAERNSAGRAHEQTAEGKVLERLDRRKRRRREDAVMGDAEDGLSSAEISREDDEAFRYHS